MRLLRQALDLIGLTCIKARRPQILRLDPLMIALSIKVANNMMSDRQTTNATCALAYYISKDDRESYPDWFHQIHITEKLARPGYRWAADFEAGATSPNTQSDSERKLRI